MWFAILAKKADGGERLHSRTRDLYHALALPLGKNADLCGILVDLFEIQQDINREALSPASGAVLEFLFEWIHVHLGEGKVRSESTNRGEEISDLNCYGRPSD